MNSNNLMWGIDLALLAIIVVQGEFVRYYEREVYRIHAERAAERAAWREQKRRQATKKAESAVAPSEGK